ncbi:3-phosphoserine/phosphohydroxythreonine transaminase [bacterium]|nr:3-phosphoserine/phosphohydroxythreonine transaminase [bacterium]
MKEKGEIYNFCAGPAVLPAEVMEKVKEELRSYGGCGMSVMEISHRSAAFKEILCEAKSRLKELMSIPDDYSILFLQGGASLQFPMVPMNFGKGAYCITGRWAKKAFEAAELQGRGEAFSGSADRNFEYIPKIDPADLPKDAKFLHICDNNTLYGTKFFAPPEMGLPLVSDMSSCILSAPCEVEKYSLIYAGAQKNIGPAGLCVVIIKNSFLESAEDEGLPLMLRYRTYAEHDSLYNTPPTFAVYVANLVFAWLEKKGGLKVMEEINREKAKLLYDCIGNSALYLNKVSPRDRSIMNVPFRLRRRDLEPVFLAEAEKAGLMNLKGHWSIGGIRASIYNAMPIEGVKKLVNFMQQFEGENL